MEQFTRKSLEQLLQLRNKPVISIYFPTVKKGPEQQQNPIRFSNMIKKAKDMLEKSGASNHQIKVKLDEVAQLEHDPDYWKYQRQGLAIFVTPDEYRFVRLPIKVKELVTVNHHPFIKPLLPLITTNGQFFILTLSQNNIKLYQANRTDIDKLHLGDDVSVSMDDYFADTEVRTYLQFHTGTSSSGNRPGVFHGQGGGEEDYKKDIEEFLNHIENSVTDLLEGEQAPLVLAGVEFLTSMYAKLNKYNHLVEDIIEGNPESTDKQALHAAAWKIVRPIFKANEQTALDAFHSLQGTGKTSNQVPEVVTGAFDGRVKDLFILRDHEVWGEYVEDAREVLVHDERTAKSLDLLDLATAQTILTKGNVYSLKANEMIADSVLAATFRY